MKSRKLLFLVFNALLVLICLIIGGYVSLHLGQDANFDLTNYHIYNAWAFLHERWKMDLFVAGIQGYFSPYIELPYYVLAFRWLPDYPRTVAFLMGLPYGLLIYFTTLVTWFVLEDYSVKPIPRAIVTLIVVIFGVTGVAVVSQVGTTFNEIQTAALVIAGVALLTYGLRGDKGHLPIAASGTGGLLFGLAAGLKFTASIYAPAAVLGIFIVARTCRYKVSGIALFAFSWFVAFLVTYGWWGWHLYATTGNPMYPMFDNVFHSPFAPPLDLVHVYHVFKPHTLVQWLFYPFFWLSRQASAIGIGFADPRFAVGMSAVLLLVLLTIWKLLRANQFAASVGRREILAPSALFVIVFVATSYAEWLRVFSYLRYAVPIEVLLGVVVIIALLQIFPRRHSAVVPITIVGMLAVLGVSVATTVYPDFGRLEYGERVWSVQPVQLPPHSLIIMFGGPNGYLAPAIAEQNVDVVFVGDPGSGYTNKKYKLGREFFKKVNEHNGPIYVLKRTDMDTYSAHAGREQEMDGILKAWAVSVSPALCLPFSSNMDWDLEICSAHNASNTTWAPAPRSPWPGTPSVPTVPAPDQHTPSFTVRWTGASLGGAATGERTYTLLMAHGAGSFTQVYSGPSTAAKVTVDYDGTYSFKVKTCAQDACSGFSDVSSSYDTYIKPSEPQELRVTSVSTPIAAPAAYTVSWSVPLVRGTRPSYKLQEESGQGNFITIYSGVNTSYSVVHDRSGNYKYRVIACDTFKADLCSDPTASHAVSVVLSAARTK